MAAKTSDKKTVEILFEEARITALPERRLPLSRNLVTVELIWPKVGTAKKSASREVRFRKGVFDFTAEQWAKRCVFREEIDGHCGIVVSVSEPVSVQNLKRWAKLTAKAILKGGLTSRRPRWWDIRISPRRRLTHSRRWSARRACQNRSRRASSTSTICRPTVKRGKS